MLNLLIFIMIVGWGVGSFFYKIASSNIHPIVAEAIITGVYILIIPILWNVIKFNHQVNATGLVAAIIGSVFMCAGTLAYMFLLQKGNVGSITILGSVYPGLTLLLSILFLGEQLTYPKIIGILCACASLFFLSKG